MRPGLSLSILVPVYNEEGTAVKALREILDADIGAEREIIVVDDGSTDGTAAALAAESWPDNVRFISHPSNRGKGGAIQTGLTAATGTHTAIMDADLEYRPEDLGKLVAAASEGHEVVFGTRAFEAHSAHSFWYVIGNRTVTHFGNLLFNCWLSDMMTCHKLIPTELFRSLDLRENGFAIEAEITARLLRRHISIYEVPVAYQARSHEAGKKLTATDGLRVLRTLIRCRVS
ncbi:MAG TPA: glycosyltransferase family 2 protein [Solirubrobacterales bacterium]